MRAEIIYTQYDAHLRHMLNDDSQPTDFRYYINSVALNFIWWNRLNGMKLTHVH